MSVPASREEPVVGLYAWATRARRRTRWHVFEGQAGGRIEFACGVSLATSERGVPARKMVTRIVSVRELFEEATRPRAAGWRQALCRGCVMHVGMKWEGREGRGE